MNDLPGNAPDATHEEVQQEVQADSTVKK
jgi:hypothetical protein